MTHTEKRGHWLKEGVLGLSTGILYGMTSVAVGHPFDTIKCWGTGTKLLMYDGTTKNVEDIVRDSRLGFEQLLMGDDEKARRVIPGSTCSNAGMLYQIASANPARPSWTCNANHILVCRVLERATLRRSRDGSWMVANIYSLQPGVDDCEAQRSFIVRRSQDGRFTCEEDAQEFLRNLRGHPLEFECTVADFLSMPERERSACRMFQADRVSFAPPSDSFHSRLSKIAKNEMTEELVLETARRIGSWMTKNHEQLELKDCLFNSLLQSYDLLSSKHMPNDLLRESIEVRHSLLEGILCETSKDDTKSHLSCPIQAKDPNLLDGFVQLARSLGYSPSAIQPVDSICFQVSIGNIDLSSCSSKHSTPTDDAIAVRSDAFTITPAGHGDFWGFELDGNSRCLLADFTITHNTKMQAQSGYLEGGGTFSALSKVWKAEGIKGLYRGWLPPLWGSGLYRSTQFAVYEALYTKWDANRLAAGAGGAVSTGGRSNHNTVIPFTYGLETRVLQAAFVASLSRAIIECPIEYAKVARQTNQVWGIRQVYTGFGVQWVRTWGVMTTYFILIDTTRRHYPAAFSNPIGQFLVSSCSATFGFWLVWPFEVLKNQVQAKTPIYSVAKLHEAGIHSVAGITAEGASKHLPAPLSTPTLLDRTRYLLFTHGITGLYRGIGAGTARSMISNGFSMVVMLQAQRKITEWGWRN